MTGRVLILLAFLCAMPAVVFPCGDPFNAIALPSPARPKTLKNATMFNAEHAEHAENSSGSCSAASAVSALNVISSHAL